MPDMRSPAALGLLEPKEVIARFELNQYIYCPHCKREFNVLAVNALNPSKEFVTITQKVYNDCERGKFKGTKEVTVTIPRPHWVGAIGQDTENLHESMDCPYCARSLIITESRWDYGYYLSRSTGGEFLARILRRALSALIRKGRA